MRHHHRLFQGLLIALFSLFAASSLVAFGLEESTSGSTSCNEQMPDADYANVSEPPGDVVETPDGYANLPPSSKDVSGADWWVGYPGTGEPDSAYANLPPYSKGVVAETPTDGYANLPPYSKDPTVSATTRTARDHRPGDIPIVDSGEREAVSTDVTSSDYLARTAENPAVAGTTEVAEIYVPIGIAPAAYAAHTELFSVATDCDDVLAEVPTWITIQVEGGLEPTSTAIATCNGCESTAF